MSVLNKQKQQNVTIKGTKDGLTLHLNDTCSFAELLTELKTKLLTNKHGDADQIVTVYVKIGNRYLTTEQETELKALRHCIRRGCPFGHSAWVASTAERLGLESTLRTQGRPRKMS